MPRDPCRSPFPATRMTLIVIVILGGWLTIARAQNTCISLRTSQTCPAFADYYIGVPGLGQRFPFLNGVVDVSSFDQHLSEYTDTPNTYLAGLGCNTESSSVPIVRYSLTRICAILVHDTNHSLPCNVAPHLSPPPVCQSTCNAWVESITSLTANASLCPDTARRQNALRNLATQCRRLSGLNGTAAQQCISGDDNEPGTCGFQNDVSSACQYCSDNRTSACCSTLKASCESGLTAGQVAGVVVGSIAGAGVAGALLFWFCRYRPARKRVTKDGFSFSTYTRPRDNRTHSSSQGLISHAHIQSPSSTHTSPHLDPEGDDDMPPPLPLSQADHHLNESYHVNSDIPGTAPSSQPNTENMFVVLYPYQPQVDDELELQLGDIVCLIYEFDDGWALGYNLLAETNGVFPKLCVAPVSPEMIEQLERIDLPVLPPKIPMEEDVSETQPFNGSPSVNGSPPVGDKNHQKSHHRLTTLNMQSIKDKVRRSLSMGSFPYTTLSQSETMHNAIPKRTASMRNTHVCSKANYRAPPTPSTPFFDTTEPLTPIERSASTTNGRQSPTWRQHAQDVYELHEQHTPFTHTNGFQNNIHKNHES